MGVEFLQTIFLTIITLNGGYIDVTRLFNTYKFGPTNKFATGFKSGHFNIKTVQISVFVIHLKEDVLQETRFCARNLQ